MITPFIKRCIYRMLISSHSNDTAATHLSNPSLPEGIANRITTEKSQGCPWTSALSVNDWLLLKKYRVTPVRMALGTSVFQNGFSESFYQCFNSSMEVHSVEHAIYSSCKLALRRLQKEASLLGAHAVVGITMKTELDTLFGHTVEATFYGTAITVEGLEKPEVPVLCTVSVPEFVKLIESGSMPHGMAIGVGVYYERISWSSWWKNLSLRNKEIPSYTQAMYTTRHIAMKNLNEDAKKIGGHGVLAQQLKTFTRQVGTDDKIFGYSMHFILLGTVIIDEPTQSLPKFTVALSLNK
jgi:uncharacterized protein YbjQ (UPF0145 family)